MVAAPVFTPPAGLIQQGPTVSLSTPTSTAAQIYYTTDAMQPNANSAVYSNSSPDRISNTLEVTAYAKVPGYAANSPTSSAIYVINPNGAPASFTVSAASSTVTAVPGTAGASVGITVTSQYGFNAAVNLACSDLPAGSACGFFSSKRDTDCCYAGRQRRSRLPHRKCVSQLSSQTRRAVPRGGIGDCVLLLLA